MLVNRWKSGVCDGCFDEPAENGGIAFSFADVAATSWSDRPPAPAQPVHAKNADAHDQSWRPKACRHGLRLSTVKNQEELFAKHTPAYHWSVRNRKASPYILYQTEHPRIP